jgi:hypothetical protein
MEISVEWSSSLWWKRICKWTGELQVYSVIFNNNAAANWTVINMALLQQIASSTAAGFRPCALWDGRHCLVYIHILNNILGTRMEQIAGSATRQTGSREKCCGASRGVFERLRCTLRYEIHSSVGKTLGISKFLIRLYQISAHAVRIFLRWEVYTYESAVVGTDAFVIREAPGLSRRRQTGYSDTVTTVLSVHHSNLKSSTTTSFHAYLNLGFPL